jgi:hypothetical protein
VCNIFVNIVLAELHHVNMVERRNHIELPGQLPKLDLMQGARRRRRQTGDRTAENYQS